MLKIIEVEVVRPYCVSLVFSDGFAGEVNLSGIFGKTTYSAVENFDEFALVNGGLSWGELDIAADQLRAMAQGGYQPLKPDPARSDYIKHILQDALWQAVEENRPDIFQGAIAMLVEQYGHSRVVHHAGIKSRTSAYRSLKGGSSPKLDTLIKLGHAALDIAKSA